MQVRTRPICPIYFPTECKPMPAITIEEWLPVDIPGVVPNYYMVSNTGKLKNIKGQELHSYLINSGYLVFKLYTGNKYKNKYKSILVHRLIKMTFDPVPNMDQLTVNHEDLNPYNNNLWNLTWQTQAENNIHKQNTMQLDGTRNYQALFGTEQLRIIVKELQKGTNYGDILSIIGWQDTLNYRDYIGNIKRGRTYQREVKMILGE